MSGWDLFLQQTVNGIVLGSGYVLVAVGFTLCLGVLKLINVAQGHFVMLGAFVVIQFYTGWFGDTPVLSNYFVCIGFAVLVVSLVGIGVHYAGIRPVRGRGQVAPILTTIALASLIGNIARVQWPEPQRTLLTSLATARNPIGEVFITDQKILTVVAAFVLMLVLWLFLKRSRIGKALRATAQNEMSASLMGINPHFMFLLAMILSAAFAAAAGGFIATLTTPQTNMGLSYLFKAMIVVLLGGMGNVGGAILGGMLLGLMEAFIGGFWDASWVNVTVFGIIIVLLIVRPSGLISSKET